MKKILWSLLFTTLMSAQAHALTSIICSEILDENGDATGATNIGLGTERDDSSKKEDWVLSFGEQKQEIDDFKIIWTKKTKNLLAYQVIQMTDPSAHVGVEYTFFMKDCEESKGYME